LLPLWGLFLNNNMATIVWLNGPSRQPLIKTLPQQNIEVGCNYIRNDRKVNHVVCFDQPMMKALTIEPVVTYWTRGYYAKPNMWNTVKNIEGRFRVEAQNSGILAIQLAHNLTDRKKDNIYIIGCDWGLSNDTAYDYSSVRGKNKYPLKHSNHCIKHLYYMNKTDNNIFIVHNDKPDVTIPIITIKDFLQKIQ